VILTCAAEGAAAVGTTAGAEVLVGAAATGALVLVGAAACGALVGAAAGAWVAAGEQAAKTPPAEAMESILKKSRRFILEETLRDMSSSPVGIEIWEMDWLKTMVFGGGE